MGSPVDTSPHDAPDGPAAMGYKPPGHPERAHGRVGVLLINLGTPDATDYWSMRRYLKEFLSDRRVVDTPRAIWWPLLNGVILTIRPGRSGAAYDKIWNRERDESPLRTITRAQAEDLGRRLGGSDDNVLVDWAMRYGNPSIAERLTALAESGATRILLAPLYPQYSAATTATALDKAYETLLATRWQPAIRTLPPYYDHPEHIEALAGSITGHLAGLDWSPEVTLASFHGLPERYLTEGDPYYCHCMKTARLLRARLGLDEERFRVVFQSLFGREEWLKPYAEPTVIALAKAGVKRLAMVMPGFSADCVETLEEVAIGIREVFETHGGESFTAIPCLNDSPTGMDMLETLVREELSGWIAASSDI